MSDYLYDTKDIELLFYCNKDMLNKRYVICANNGDKTTIMYGSKGMVVNSTNYVFFEDFIKYMTDKINITKYMNIRFEIEFPQFITFYLNINNSKTRILLSTNASNDSRKKATDIFLSKLPATLHTLNISEQVYEKCIRELNNLPICLKYLQIRVSSVSTKNIKPINKIPFDCTIQKNLNCIKSKKWISLN